MTIKEQFDHVDFEKIFDSCTINSNKYVDCNKIITKNVFINMDQVCMTLFSQLNGESDDRFIIRDSKVESIDIILNEEKLKNVNSMELKLHSRRRINYDYFEIGYQFFEIPSYIELDYNKIIIQNKAIYSLCDDKSNEYECKIQCRIENHIKIEKKYPYLFSINDKNSNLIFDDKEIDYNIIDKECEAKCKTNLECNKEYYMSYPRNTGFKAGSILVRLFFPKWITIYELNPKLYFQEFLCQFASIISLWFGLTILVATDFLILCMDKFNIYLKPRITRSINKIKIAINKLNLNVRLRNNRVIPSRYPINAFN